ncbi:TPA: restriction endonuclease subunit S [Vibrio vulnificus]|nr:restriction endonuclease subunit S [Vibrio vulnificus]
MSAEKLITDHIDIWTSAVQAKSASGRGSSKKRELYGIKKLRELILELAVRGKLVPQDPNDEPASVLLERIAAEKAQLVKEKKLKKPNKLPEISEKDKLFELPDGWEFVRWGQIAYWAIGSGFPKTAQGESGNSILFSKVSDMNLPGNERYIKTTINTISEDVAAKIKAKLHPQGTVIFPKIGGAIATNKRRILTRDTAIDNNCLGLIPSIGITSDFLYLVLSKTDLVAYQAGTSVPALSQSTLELILAALPPIKEQHRIVAKVDELMALCDQLEQQTEASLDAHQVLVETLLATLTNSQDATELMANWGRISEHFDTLFTTEQSIDQLKQTILQLAVMGKLVPFGSNTEKGGLKKFLSFGPRNGYSPKEVKSDTGVKVLKLGATSYGSLDLNESKSVDVDIERDSHLWLNKGDILIQRGNSANYVGCNCLVEEDVSGVIYPDLMMKIRPSDITSSEFLSMWLSSPMAREFMWSRMTGTSGTMPKISKKVVESIPIVMPSRQTQDSIVAKAQDLLSICEHLKQRIRDIQQTQLQLTDTIVEQAL